MVAPSGISCSDEHAGDKSILQPRQFAERNFTNPAAVISELLKQTAVNADTRCKNIFDGLPSLFVRQLIYSLE